MTDRTVAIRSSLSGIHCAGGVATRVCIWKSLAFFTVVLLSGIGDATADELGVQFGVENFRWREYSAGSRLLEESGPRYHVGADWRRPFRADERLLLQVRGSLYFGRVDYDGQACTLAGSCVPFMTDTDYSGVGADATIARRFGGESGGEVFGGGGIDTWRRGIKGRGNVQGVTEDWTTLFVLVGGGGYWTAPAARVHVRAGLKHPVYTENLPDSYDVVLEPNGRTSFFARFATDFLSGGKPRWGLGVYYDSYRFEESDKERSGSVLIWQPKSNQDVVGVYGTIYLR